MFLMHSLYPFSHAEVNAIPPFKLHEPCYLLASDNEQLAYYPFAVTKATKEIVVLYHGASLYSNRMYQWIARDLTNMNVATVLVDMRGHGRSGGVRGDAPSVVRMYQDVDEIMDHLTTQYPDAQLYAAGHSSGAGLLLNYVDWKQQKSEPVPFKGLIFLAPYLGPNSGCTRFTPNQPECFAKEVRPWVYILNALSGGYLCKHTRAVTFRYPEQELLNDALIVPTQTCVLSCALSPYDPQSLFKKLSLPFTMFIGSHDEQLIAQKVISFAHMADSSYNKKAEIIDNAKHLSIVLDAPRLIVVSLRSFNE